MFHIRNFICRGRKGATMKKWVCLVLLLVFLFSLKAFSGKVYKWGKVSKNDLALENCTFDSTASAAILYDYGKLNYRYNNVSDLYRHRKLKVLNQNGNKYANVVIRYYSNNNIEYIKNIKAHTINVSDNGNLIKTKIEPKDIYLVRIDEYWSEVRFSFPDVKVGSILEYQYIKVFNEFIPNFEWSFQSSELPTMVSEYEVDIDKHLDVKTFYNSPRLLKNFGYEKRDHWELYDLPAIKNEPFFYTTNDYIERIQVQLVGVYDLNESRTYYTNFLNTWGDLAVSVLGSPAWSTFVSTSSFFVDDILKELIKELDSEEEKLREIYYYVLNEFTWDGQTSIFPNSSLNAFTEIKKGNSAEINLLLNLLLNEAGLNSNPVLISTKENGTVSQYPVITEFNQVIVHVVIDGQEILLNATDDFRPYFLLAKTELNDRGLLLEKDNLRWISLNLDRYSVLFLYGDVYYSDSLINYELNYAFSGYYALENRKLINSQNSLEEYVVKYLLPQGLYVNVDSVSYKNILNIEGNLEIKCYLSEKNDTSYSFSYIKPVIYNTIKENPFKDPQREYPVDFLYPFREISIYTIHYPNETEVLEIPGSAEVRFAGDHAVYKYISTELENNKVYIRSELLFNSTYYATEYYPFLQEFFSKMLAKNQENITLLFK